MNNLENKQELTKKIQFLKELVNGLSEFSKSEDNILAEIFSQLLEKLADMFEEVEKRLKALEKAKATE